VAWGVGVEGVKVDVFVQNETGAAIFLKSHLPWWCIKWLMNIWKWHCIFSCAYIIINSSNKQTNQSGKERIKQSPNQSTNQSTNPRNQNTVMVYHHLNNLYHMVQNTLEKSGKCWSFQFFWKSLEKSGKFWILHSYEKYFLEKSGKHTPPKNAEYSYVKTNLENILSMFSIIFTLHIFHPQLIFNYFRKWWN